MNNSYNLEKPKEFVEKIVDYIHEIKGKEVVSIDMKNVGPSIADYFIICHADSDRQVDAIAHNIIDKIKEEIKITPWHKEGFENSQWILIDYANVIVHVFIKDQREFYNLEDLWADGEFATYDDNK